MLFAVQQLWYRVFNGALMITEQLICGVFPLKRFASAYQNFVFGRK